MKNKRLSTAILLVLVLLLTACGNSQGQGGGGTKLVIGESNLGLSYPFPAAIARGIKKRAAQLGVQVIELDAQGSADKQSNDVQDLIARNPNGILLLPLDAGLAQQLVDRIYAAHIPVIAVASAVGKDRPLKDVYPKLTALITQDEIKAGAQAAQIALKAFPQGAKVAIIEGQAGFAEVQEREQDFKSILSQQGKFTFIASQPGDWLPDKGQAACANILQAHPDIDLFYAESDDMAVGCAKAVTAAHSHAQVIGIGGSHLGIQAVKEGQMLGTVCYKPETMGELALQAIYDQLAGKQHYSHTFLTYDIPPITKDNVDQCVPQW
ncbi:MULTISPECIES: sugar ABC transporter substrate-binding protein [Thermogemmatispora]|uniref:sugar ABC transporter substrate-binding protein n=1 Tax=Thermogemmatispora TaxID=768669 RepID=UPI00114C948B|nr:MULTISPECIES: sugar ABC transporter substrate-binding protein [Thermogemmatispora]